MRLRALAPAKVNLCLFVGALRGDGRHELVTLFESVSLADEVELSTHPGPDDELVCSGVEGPNIVARTLQLLRAAGWEAPPVRVRITKRIPIAAGMGGGSADAGAVLRIAERVGGVSAAMTRVLAQQLGADVPFALEPGFALATGAGERVAPPEWPLTATAPHAFLVLPSDRQLSTADVYAEADRLNLARGQEELEQLHLLLQRAVRRGEELPSDLLVNDLQLAATSLCPSIEPALHAAREAGADQAFVSGSGPTVVGLYWGREAAARAGAAVESLGERHPQACVASPVERGFGFPLFA